MEDEGLAIVCPSCESKHMKHLGRITVLLPCCNTPVEAEFMECTDCHEHWYFFMMRATME